jgi:hypothetical protein
MAHELDAAQTHLCLETDSGNASRTTTAVKEDVRADAPTTFGFTVTRRSRGKLFPRVRVNHETRLFSWCTLTTLALVILMGAAYDSVANRDVWVDLRANERKTAMVISGIFLFFATVFTARQIAAHRRNWNHPASQKYIVGILLLVPIYGFASWMGVVVPRLGSWLEFPRGIYEGLAIYCFRILMTEYVGGHARAARHLVESAGESASESASENASENVSASARAGQRTAEAAGVRLASEVHTEFKAHSKGQSKAQLRWPPPLCCKRPVDVSSAKPAERFMRVAKYGVLQYPVVQTLAMLAAAVLTLVNKYNEGSFAWSSGYVYIVLARNLSQVPRDIKDPIQLGRVHGLLCINRGVARFADGGAVFSGVAVPLASRSAGTVSAVGNVSQH